MDGAGREGPGVVVAADNEKKKKPNILEQVNSYLWFYYYKQWLTLFFGAPKSLQMVIAAMKLKDAYSLEGKL